MSGNKKQVSKADVVRIMLCAFIGLLLVASIIPEYVIKRHEYNTSFRVGEQLGKIVSIIEVGHMNGDIKNNGQYLSSMIKANLMICNLTEESIEDFLETALPLAGVEVSNQFDLITNEEAFWDGYYMRAFDKSIVFAQITRYITAEQAQELFEMRDEICKQPTHKKADEYSMLMLQLFFFSEEVNN